MGMLSRMYEIFQAKMNRLLNRVENPSDTLDLSYEKMLKGLQDTKRSLADVVAEQRSLQRQIEVAQGQAGESENDAKLALQNGREDLAKAALGEKQAALAKLDTLKGTYESVKQQVDKLVSYERQLEGRIEQFRTQKEVMKSSYAAAQAQVKVTEALTGIGDGLSGTGDAMKRAGDKVEAMRNKADAMEGLIESGVLSDPLDSRTSVQKQLGEMRATSGIDADLERLKAEMAGKALPGTDDKKA
jgi:phage shock protein A